MRPRRLRNAWWLIALPFIIVVAVLASSQRMFNVHLKWELTSPVQAVDNTVHLVQEYDHFGESHQLEVTVTILEVAPVPEVVDGFQYVKAPPGGVLWQIDVEFEAPPESVLAFCEGMLIADGVSYSPNAGKVDALTGDYIAKYTDNLSCAPLETPGPQHEFFGPGTIPADTPRPPRWEQSFSFALPAGVQPEELRLWWHRPVYLSFPLDP